MPFPVDPDPDPTPADVAARLAIVRAEKVAEAGGSGPARGRGLVGRGRDWLPSSGVMPNGRRWRKVIPEE